MAEHLSSSSSSSSSSQSSGGGSGGMTIDIRPMIEDVSQVMTKHITSILSGVIGEYTVYKETHDTIMGLPCVRRLQERINELETRDNSCANSNNKGSIESNGGGVTREDEIHQLQSAIAELNRYIVALESKVDMKTVCSSSSSLHPSPQADSSQSFAEHHHEEESIRLEIHENEPVPKNNQEDSFVPCSNTKNVIVSSSSGDDEGDDGCVVADQQEEEQEEQEDQEEQDEQEQEEENGDDKATETTEDLASLVETVKQEIEADEEDAVDEAEEEAEEEEAVEEEEEAVEEEEEVVEEEEEQPAAAEEEAEIEVSEIKIKGKTYFTTDPQNGIIYACVDDDVGDEVGVFKNGVAVFNKGKK